MKGWSSIEKLDEKLKKISNQAPTWIWGRIQHPKHACKFSNKDEIGN